MKFCLVFLLLCSVVNAQPNAEERLKHGWAARERWLAKLQEESDFAAEYRAKQDRDAEIDSYRVKSRDDGFLDFNDLSRGKVASGARDLIKIKSLKERLANPRARLSAAERRSLQAEIKEEMKKPSGAKAAAEAKRRKKEADDKITELKSLPLKVKKVDVISSIRRDLTRWPMLDIEDAEIGDIGLLPPYPVGELTNVERAVMEQASQALERNQEYPPEWRTKAPVKFATKHAIHGRHNIQIIQVIDETESLAAPYSIGPSSLSTALFRLRGISTKELADDSTIRLNAVMEVTGTKKYETVRGASKTVMVLEPFDLERARPLLAN